MSAVFGFKSNLIQRSSSDLMNELDHWNEPYGYEAVRLEVFHQSGIGCRIEHFSDCFSFGGPIIEFDGKYAAIDALLYNRVELLLLLGFDENNAISDEELLLNIIRKKGFDALSQVNGDFAGAIYNPIACEWTLFRDHLGVRPLYYYLSDDFFTFSTDIRGIVALLGDRARPNAKRQYRRFSGYRTITLCETDYDSILCIHPGSYTVISTSDSAFHKREYLYWSLHQQKPRYEKDIQYLQEFRRLIIDAVKRRADAIPGLLGAELSGGLDSSVISILLSRLGRETVHYSWSQSVEELPLQDGEDERRIIQEICDQENFTCDYYTPSREYTPQEYLDFSFPAHTDTYQISYGSELLRAKGATVMFTGHGGDEGVSHRCTTYEMLCNGEWKHYFNFYWQGLKGNKHRIWNTICYAVKDAVKAHNFYGKPFFTNDLSAFLLKTSFREKMKRIVSPEKAYFNGQPYMYINNGGTRQRMDNVAFQGAKCGVRYLFPYVDYRVIDFAVSIPRYLFLYPGIDRLIFREAFRDIIPKSLYDVRYKDTASIRGRRDASNRIEILRKVHELLPLLDREYWGDILDFEEIDKLPVPSTMENCPEYQYTQAMEKLLPCLLIQNVRDKAREWREAHE